MVERRQSLTRLDRQFNSVEVGVQKQADRARKLLCGLIEHAEASEPFPELPFMYQRRGPDCVHVDVRHEKSVELGEETDNYKRGYHIILKHDGAIVSVATTDTRRVYTHERERRYERQHGGFGGLVIHTKNRLREVQYSGDRQTELTGVNYLKWSFKARAMLVGASS